MIVDVIAPGYGSQPEDIPKVVSYLEGLGLEARIPADIFAPHLLHAQADAVRFSHLEAALTAPDSTAIWCFKGGYGTAKLLPMLRALTPPKKPKTLIGFSDITALHLFLNQQWRWPTLHAPVLWRLIHGKVDAACGLKVRDYIKNPGARSFTLQPMNAAAATYRGEARVTGGNLALLQTSIGTFWQAQTAGRFLLIEEVDEAAYRVDRMLLHLTQAGLLADAEAVLLGDFVDRTSPEAEQKIRDILEHFAVGQTRPVFRIRAIGHGPLNDPLMLGMPSGIRDGLLTITPPQ